MPRDAEKARASKRRYLERKKIEKYGPDAAGKDMRGRHGNHARGAKHFRWNNGRAMSSHGYIKIFVGHGHDLADPNGYAYEHVLVWVAAGYGRPAPDEVIHHRNEVKTDNRLENLERLTRSGHAMHHNALRGRNGSGRFTSGDPDPEVSTRMGDDAAAAHDD